MNIFYGILLGAAVIINFLLRPPAHYTVRDKPFSLSAKINGVEKKVDAFLIWKQSSFNVAKVFYFFPTSGELQFYNPEHEIRWNIKPQFQSVLKDRYMKDFSFPLWRYFLASITLLFFGIVYGLQEIGSALQTDYQRWKKARENDSFLGYKNYLLEKRRLKLHQGKARKRMQLKVNEYKYYYQFLTACHSGSGKQFFLKILDTIAQTGSLEVGITFNFVNNIVEHKERNRQEINKLKAFLNQARNKGSLPNEDWEKIHIYVKSLEEQMSFNVVEVGKYFNEKRNKGREQIITKIIDRVFARIFPEQIITFVYGAKNTPVKFTVEYAVSTMGTLYSKTSEQHLPENKKNYFTGVEFAWKMRAFIHNSPLFVHKFNSKPYETFSIASDKPGDVYKAMAMSAFVNFGKEMLKFFGIQFTNVKDTDFKNISLTDRKNLQHELFQQFKHEVKDQAYEEGARWLKTQSEKFFEQHEEDISQMINSLTIELEQMMTVYVNGLSKGIDVGELGEKAISAIFGEE